jgi:hypothetical protein
MVNILCRPSTDLPRPGGVNLPEVAGLVSTVEKQDLLLGEIPDVIEKRVRKRFRYVGNRPSTHILRWRDCLANQSIYALRMLRTPKLIHIIARFHHE